MHPGEFNSGIGEPAWTRDYRRDTSARFRERVNGSEYPNPT
jgi:hypothetical protein